MTNSPHWFPQWLHQLAVLPTLNTFLSCILTSFLIRGIPKFNNLTRVRRHLRVVVVRIYPLAKNVEQLFYVFICWENSLKICSPLLLGHLFSWVFVFLYYLYILDIIPLSDVDRSLIIFLCPWIFSFPTTNCSRCKFLSTVCFWHLCQISDGCSYMNSHLGPPPFDLHLCFGARSLLFLLL